MSFKRFVATFICVIVLFSEFAIAQDGYTVIATRNSAGIIQRPNDRKIEIGETFLAKRKVGRRYIDVAKVVVALLDSRFCGFKVIESLTDTRLLRGDLIVEIEKTENTGSDQDLLDDILDVSGSRATKNSQGSNQANASQTTSGAVNTIPAPSGNLGASTGEFQDFSSKRVDAYGESSSGQDDENYRFVGPEETDLDEPATLFGFSVAGLFPLGTTASRYAPSPKFGLQLLTDIGQHTNLRIGMQYTYLISDPAVKSAQAALGQKRTSHLTFLTLSVQPRIFNNVIIDLGGGYYRELNIITAGNSVNTLARNALGTVAGLGFNVSVGENSNIMVMGTGNFYFYGGGNETFSALTASWLFGI